MDGGEDTLVHGDTLVDDDTPQLADVHSSLRALTGLLLDDHGFDDAADVAMRTAQTIYSGESIVSLTVRDPGSGKQSTRTATGEVAEALDRWQYEHGEGPCIEADRSGQPVLVPDLIASDRFPEFTEVAEQHGVRAVASYPLRVDDRSLGSLNVFLLERELDRSESDRGQQLADDIAPVLANWVTHQRLTTLVDQLEEALHGRAIIERAKGVMMARLEVDEQQAFDLLAKQSQHENRKLRDVATTFLEDLGRSR